jgi:hypothetical protein
VLIMVHFRFFLHIGFRQKREDLQLLLFSALLLIIMVTGTLWIMASLAVRMTMQSGRDARRDHCGSDPFGYWRGGGSAGVADEEADDAAADDDEADDDEDDAAARVTIFALWSGR